MFCDIRISDDQNGVFKCFCIFDAVSGSEAENIVSFLQPGIGNFEVSTGTIWSASMRVLGKSMHVVGKIVESESFMLKRSFQVLVHSLEIVYLEASFQHKTFQLNHVSNYT